MPLAEWGAQVLDECIPLAARLDAEHGNSDYSSALAAARALMDAPERTPSARVLATMASAHGNSFNAFTLAQSRRVHEALLDLPWSAEQQARQTALAEESVAAKKAIEASDTQDFEAWRQNYMAASGLI